MPSNMVLPHPTTSQSRHASKDSGAFVTSTSGGGSSTLYFLPTSLTRLVPPVLRNKRIYRLLSITMITVCLGSGLLVFKDVQDALHSTAEIAGELGETLLEVEESISGGLIVGAKGKFWGTGEKEEEVGMIEEPSVRWEGDFNDYGWPKVIGKGSSEKFDSELAEKMVEGLDPIKPNPILTEPLSSLGARGDNSYIWGAETLQEYTQSLHSFIEHAFPTKMHSEHKAGIAKYLTAWDLDYFRLEGIGMRDGTKTIYMTDKDKNRMANSNEVLTWVRNPDSWPFRFLDDWEMEKWVKGHFDGSTFYKVWEALPMKILKADTLRYLLLYISGGVYTDIDTKLLKSMSEWGKTATFWNEGKGWMDEEAARDIHKKWKKLPPPSVIVGIEADVGDREDWYDWWPRPLQMVQWTIAASPRHPILLDVLQGITRSTSKAITWDVSHSALLSHLRSDTDPTKQDLAARVNLATIKSEPSDGGPVGVMNWTGPGVWTDAVLRYLRVRYGVQWTDLRGLRKPLRVGEVLILPVTGFSPGIQNFGAGNWNDGEAMVEHLFAGSWKGQD